MQYSAVCGIGLGCVPVPGTTSRAQLAALIRDTAALALRYGRPLTGRLFPRPGLGPSEATAFESESPCN